MSGHVIISHGLESGPDASKATALARVAGALGWTHERPDYRDLDVPGPLGDVKARIRRLAEDYTWCSGRGTVGRPLGSGSCASGSETARRDLGREKPEVWPARSDGVAD